MFILGLFLEVIFIPIAIVALLILGIYYLLNFCLVKIKHKQAAKAIVSEILNKNRRHIIE